MRLLNTSTLELEEFLDHRQVEYSILSHCWSQDRNDREVTYEDFITGANREGQGWTKILRLCEISQKHGYDWTWIDTCCIDKSSSAELSEAINSMWKWYEASAECFVFLGDCRVDHLPSFEICRHSRCDDPRLCDSTMMAQHLDQFTEQEHTRFAKFGNSTWFSRGWTLQELLAPTRVVFFNQRYVCLGNKEGLAAWIARYSGIPMEYIVRPSDVLNSSYGRYPSVAGRMSWAARRTTTREEDQAYCLLGVFGVNMPLLYGEGRKAFGRLQEEIMRSIDDFSILAWDDGSLFDLSGGLMASDPSDFKHSGHQGIMHASGSEILKCSMTNRGLEVVTSNGHVEVAREIDGDVILRLSKDVGLRLCKGYDGQWIREKPLVKLDLPGGEICDKTLIELGSPRGETWTEPYSSHQDLNTMYLQKEKADMQTNWR
ncbi:hypothetical protein B0A48_17808 [Cryoendolithus antarcticus]|uniref:Uncharacterized protein n=1 Tax=Cryoendolithus antarcticus TaxID=1507870 RepID=A0A1V8SAS9_9PEZI|nr:hypothetical protein B0A48_17808 [Cryoendolithus antarcticus]